MSPQSVCSECKVKDASILEELDEHNREAVKLGLEWVWVEQYEMGLWETLALQ